MQLVLPDEHRLFMRRPSVYEGELMKLKIPSRRPSRRGYLEPASVDAAEELTPTSSVLPMGFAWWFFVIAVVHQLPLVDSCVEAGFRRSTLVTDVSRFVLVLLALCRWVPTRSCIA